ncbi:MAG: glycosyltransferase [Anaerolineae bacterium]|nr:glycosyltransferase [Anaerolineae bacterium]
MDKPHVFHMIDGLTFGGAETLLRDLAAGLESRGYQITVGYSTPGPFVSELEKKGVRLVRFPRLGLIDPFLTLRLVRFMRKEKPQVFHTHLFKSDFHGRLAARLAGVPVVVSTLHNNDVWANNWLMGHLYGATSVWADRLIAVSEEVRQFHLQKTGVAAEKLIVIQNAVDVNAFVGHETEAKQIRTEFNITADAPLFGIVGRLKPQKNVSMFLQAAVEILRQQPNARFLIVGDGPLMPELEAQARELGLFPAVIFAGMRKDVPAILSALDVLVLSSLWEGLPVILLEAMASSLPVVSTAVDGVVGVVDPDVTAFLTPSGEPALFAEACIRLAQDPQLRKKMGRAGFEKVMQNYSLDAMIDRISDLYLQLLHNRGVSASLPTSKLDLQP